MSDSLIDAVRSAGSSVPGPTSSRGSGAGGILLLVGLAAAAVWFVYYMKNKEKSNSCCNRKANSTTNSTTTTTTQNNPPQNGSNKLANLHASKRDKLLNNHGSAKDWMSRDVQEAVVNPTPRTFGLKTKPATTYKASPPPGY